MSEPVLDPAAREEVAAFSGRIAAMKARTDDARRALAAVTASASSGDCSVTASVDASGALSAISFGPSYRDLGEAQLAAAVMQAVHQARVRVLQEAERTVVERVGADNPAVTVLQQRLASLTAPADAPATAPTPVAPVSAADVDEADEGFAGRGR